MSGSRLDAEDGANAASLVDTAEAAVLEAVGEFVWARGSTSSPVALDEALAALGWTLSTTESGTGGSLAALLGELQALKAAAVQGPAAGDPDEPDEPDDEVTSSPGDQSDGGPPRRAMRRAPMSAWRSEPGRGAATPPFRSPSRCPRGRTSSGGSCSWPVRRGARARRSPQPRSCWSSSAATDASLAVPRRRWAPR